MSEKPHRGRPISTTLEHDLVEAAIALLEERRSFDAVSVDAVCARAGASKASFYRRWPDREHFVLAVMDSLRPPPLPSGPTVSLRDDLVRVLSGMFGIDARRTRIIHSAMIAEGRRNKTLIDLYLRDIVAPRRQAVLDRLTKAVADGDLPRATDIPILHEILTSPVLKIILLTDPDHPVPERFVERIVDQAVCAPLSLPDRKT